MKKLRRPILFSSRFDVPPDSLSKHGLLDPILNSDTKLFIDPLLVKSSKNKTISGLGYASMGGVFRNIMKLLLASRDENDPAFRGAMRQLRLDERRETCLGFGDSSNRGSSRPDSLKKQILRTTKQILELGIDDPDILSLMGFLEEDVGPDTISDMTTNAIFPALAKITEDFCRRLKIPTTVRNTDFGAFRLPENPFDNFNAPVLLVPKDILRDLPIATDWSDVSRVAMENERIRERVNKLLGDFAKASVRQKKRVLREAALQSAEDFLTLFDGLVGSNQSYDQELDSDGIYVFRKALQTVALQHPLRIVAPRKADASELIRVVEEIVEQFRRLIEDNNLSDLLWSNGKPRRERASQLLFFAVADAYCRANNIDIAPEMNSGGGPVDFRFSVGYHNRYLVELKLSTGHVVSGYTWQLETYRAASDTDKAMLLVINVGRLGRKLRDIQHIKAEKEKEGVRASEIRIISALRKPSASKR